MYELLNDEKGKNNLYMKLNVFIKWVYRLFILVVALYNPKSWLV